MKAILFSVLLVLSSVVNARALMVATAPTGETLTLTSEKWECPSGTASDGTKWVARMVSYHDPRDGEKQQGCYVIDTRGSPHIVIIIFKQGSLSGAPIYLPMRLFKPEI
jgi:hypothetical protein